MEAENNHSDTYKVISGIVGDLNCMSECKSTRSHRKNSCEAPPCIEKKQQGSMRRGSFVDDLMGSFQWCVPNKTPQEESPTSSPTTRFPKILSGMPVWYICSSLTDDCVKHVFWFLSIDPVKKRLVLSKSKLSHECRRFPLKRVCRLFKDNIMPESLFAPEQDPRLFFGLVTDELTDWEHRWYFRCNSEAERDYIFFAIAYWKNVENKSTYSYKKADRKQTRP
eukprot:Platyproteum_vivax@DN6862_c0_g1_i1.p1